MWGPAIDEVYAVGGNPDRGAMWRYSGSTWAAESIPDDMPLVNWVYGVESDAGPVLWLAGNEGQLARRGPEGNWTRMSLPASSALWGIWGSHDDDMWTVGGDIPGDAPQLAHWDGSAWTDALLPATDRDFDALLCVLGGSQEAVVGSRLKDSWQLSVPSCQLRLPRWARNDMICENRRHLRRKKGSSAVGCRLKDSCQFPVVSQEAVVSSR